MSSLPLNVDITKLINCIASCNNGCKLGTDFLSIICHAVDILLLAPLSRGLQILADTAITLSNEICLIVNRCDSFFIFFKHKKNIAVLTLLRLDLDLCLS